VDTFAGRVHVEGTAEDYDAMALPFFIRVSEAARLFPGWLAD